MRRRRRRRRRRAEDEDEKEDHQVLVILLACVVFTVNMQRSRLTESPGVLVSPVSLGKRS